MAKKTTQSEDAVNAQAPKGRSVSDTIDTVQSISSTGVMSTAIGDSFYGINHRQQPSAIQINKDMHGLTFFTRPRLNLTSENIRNVRQLTPLLTNEAMSIQRIIRCTLDPRLAKMAAPVSSPFVDPLQAFIPILTNHLLSMSGWPDWDAPTFTSHEGLMKEAYSIVDGEVSNYSTYDITANFRNLDGDPITTLIATWIRYMSSVYMGDLVPYPDSLISNEIDYNTRIYRVVLDPAKRKVQKIACCGASFPLNCPLGAAFNFEADKPLNQSNDQISISFRCMGACYNDDIIIDEFNRTSGLFNVGMQESSFKKDAAGNVTNKFLVQIKYEWLNIFNSRGYPRIDPDTYELQWWVTKEDYQQKVSSIQFQDSIPTVKRIG